MLSQSQINLGIYIYIFVISLCLLNNEEDYVDKKGVACVPIAISTWYVSDFELSGVVFALLSALFSALNNWVASFFIKE